MQTIPFNLSAAQPARLQPLSRDKWPTTRLPDGHEAVGVAGVRCAFKDCPPQLGYVIWSRAEDGYDEWDYQAPRGFGGRKDPQTGRWVYHLLERVLSYHRQGLPARTKRPHPENFDWDTRSPVGQFGHPGVTHGLDPGKPTFVVCPVRSCGRIVSFTTEDARTRLTSCHSAR